MKRPGPPIQMQDVLLACGELNERERVAVQWVLDNANEEISKRLTVDEAMDALPEDQSVGFYQYIRARITAAIESKSKP